MRGYKDYIRTAAPAPATAAAASGSNGKHPPSARIPLRAGSVFGLSSSRGTRPYQEDASSVTCVHIPSEELRSSLAQSHSRVAQAIAKDWNAEKAGGEEVAGQVLWVGCFDG